KYENKMSMYSSSSFRIRSSLLLGGSLVGHWSFGISRGAALQFQQEPLSPQPPAVAAEATVLVDDTMARNEDYYPVPAVRLADGSASRRRLFHRSRQILI